MRYLIIGPVVLAIAVFLVGSTAIGAQSIANQIAAAPDGGVRLSFAARPGVCGDGRNITTRAWRATDDWESHCEPGPVRVALRVRDARPTDIDTYVGGRWRSRSGVTDLGTVSAADAASYFLDVAETARGEVAKRAIHAAWLADSVTIWPELARIARDESLSREVRESAVFWLGQSPEDEVVGALGELLASAGDRDLKEKVIFSLSQHRSNDAMRLLRNLARQRDADVGLREKAIFWLGQGHAEDGVEFLQDLYGDVEDRELKEKIIFSVSQTHDRGAAAWLTGVALDRDESTDLRKKAVFWLGQSQHEVEELLDLYDRVSSRDLQEQLIFVYSQRHHDPAALEKLMEIARDGEDVDLQRKAIFWLGQSNDPRAVDFLTELIVR